MIEFTVFKHVFLISVLHFLTKSDSIYFREQMKNGREMGQYLAGFDDFGAVEKAWT